MHVKSDFVFDGAGCSRFQNSPTLNFAHLGWFSHHRNLLIIHILRNSYRKSRVLSNLGVQTTLYDERFSRYSILADVGWILHILAYFSKCSVIMRVNVFLVNLDTNWTIWWKQTAKFFKIDQIFDKSQVD